MYNQAITKGDILDIMATIMDKDVLIEATAGCLGRLFTKYKNKLSENDYSKIRLNLVKIRKQIYSSECEDLDFYEMLHKIKNTYDEAERLVNTLNLNHEQEKKIDLLKECINENECF